MFERFDSASMRVVTSAQAEARALHHKRVETSHLLLALLARDESDTAAILREERVTHTEVVFYLIEKIGLPATKSPTHIFHTSEFRELVGDGVRIADTHGYASVTPVLLLVALMRDPLSAASEVVAGIRASRSAILDRANTILRASSPS